MKKISDVAGSGAESKRAASVHGQGKACFTLIELLVNSIISSMRLFDRCDRREQQNTSLFLKRGEGLGEGKNFFSHEKKFFPSPNILSDKRIEQCAEDGGAEDDIGGSDFKAADEKAGEGGDDHSGDGEFEVIKSGGDKLPRQSMGEN